MKRRIVILAENKFGPMSSKMASSAIRYLNEEIVAVNNLLDLKELL